MKRHLLTLVSISAMLLGTSCHKESALPEEKPQGPFEVTITGEMGEFSPTAKSSAEPCLRMKWTTGDVVWAYGKHSSEDSITGLGKLTVTVGDNDYIAVMSGTLERRPTDEKLYLVHSSLLDTKTQPSLTGGILSVNMADQTASATPFVAYATVENVRATEQPELKAKFNFATSVLKMNATGLVPGQALASATLSGVETECRLTITTSGITIGSGTPGIVTKTLSGTVPGTSRASFYVSVPKISAVTDRILTVVSGGKPYRDHGVVSQAQAENRYVSCVCEVKTLNYVDEYGVDRGEGIYIAGSVWAPVNCGYHPINFKWGKLYQWGRKYGCGYVENDSTSVFNDAGGIIQDIDTTLVDGSTVVEDATKYYFKKFKVDWLSVRDNNRWNAGDPLFRGELEFKTPVKTPMDPCPPGWRVPTYAELWALFGGGDTRRAQDRTHNEQAGIWLDGTNAEDPQSGVFLQDAGERNCFYFLNRIDYGYRGSRCAYWSSSVCDSTIWLDPTLAVQLFYDRAVGLRQTRRCAAASVRCVQE